MKKGKWKILNLLLSVGIIFSIMPMSAFASDTQNPDIKSNQGDIKIDALNYLGLGDSIPAGYGLINPDTESFVSIINLRDGIIADNKGVSGQTSVELKENVVTKKLYDTAIDNADYISITIGGND